MTGSSLSQQHRTGEYVFATGDRYEGEFANNVFDGEGSYTWVDGANYAGGWRGGRYVGTFR